MKKKEREAGIFISCVKAQAVFLVSAIILCVVLCYIAYSTADPASITVPLSLCALYLSSLLGGIAAVRISGDGIVSGLFSGLLSSLILLAFSAIPLPDSGFELPTSLLLTLAVIPMSAVGAVIGHKREKKQKRGTRHRIK